MRRLPIRLKLTLAFAAVMALVLVGTGSLLYLRFKAELNDSADQALRSRAADLVALVRQADSGLTESGDSPLARQGEGFAQILDARGHVFDGTPGLRTRPILATPQLRRAARQTTLLERPSPVSRDESARLLATPVRAQGQRLVVVVGTSLGDRDDALRSLRSLLLIGGPAALLLASLAGYGVAAAALRPVESMRRRAAAISVDEPGQRLPVPESRDEISRLGETLNRMLERLELAFERERDFVSNASHELRTPLAILKAELELALREGRTVEELGAALGSAAEETDRLAQLAEDLLVIARMDRGRLPVRPRPAHAGELFGTVAERFALRSQEAQRPIVLGGGQSIELFADPERVEQALSNVVDNALRYGAGSIELSGRVRDGHVELHVTDEGDGFPPDFLSTAFDRFTRADAARGSGGTGLGLAIVDVIARAHRGAARAANRSGGGADVWLELPADPS